METYKSTLDANHELGSVGDILSELGVRCNQRVYWEGKLTWAVDYIYRLLALGWSIESAGKQLLKDLDEMYEKKQKKNKAGKDSARLATYASQGRASHPILRRVSS